MLYLSLEFTKERSVRKVRKPARGKIFLASLLVSFKAVWYIPSQHGPRAIQQKHPVLSVLDSEGICFTSPYTAEEPLTQTPEKMTTITETSTEDHR